MSWMVDFGEWLECVWGGGGKNGAGEEFAIKLQITVYQLKLTV